LNLTGKKRIERLRRRHYDTLLATRCITIKLKNSLAKLYHVMWS